MPKSRPNPKRKLTRCSNCSKGIIYRGTVPLRVCSICHGTGMVPEKKTP